MLEAMIVLTLVLRRFELKTTDALPMRARPRITLAPTRPVRLELAERL
jgi:cytochrome P450